MSLQNDIESIVKSVDLELYDAVIVNEGEETIYRISIMSSEIEDSKRKGVSLDTCVELTHLLSPLLDVTPPVSGDYRMEVGSPGIERKLNTLKHYMLSIGEKVSLLLGDKRKVRGVLTKVSDSKLFIDVEGEETIVEYSEVVKAKTYFEW